MKARSVQSKTRILQGHSRLELIVLALILLVAVLLRVAYLREIVDEPDFDLPTVDAEFHDYWARGLVTADWSTRPNIKDPEIYRNPFFRPPGYPYFLAAVYFIAGDGYMAPRVVQMCLGLASCLMAYLLARIIFARAVSLIFAALMSVYWIFIYYEGELHEPALLMFLVLCSFYFLALWTKKAHLYYAVAAGVLMGFAALVRPNLLLFILVTTGWLIWFGLRRLNRAVLFASIVGFIAGSVLTVAPATIRNYLVADQLVLISSNAGVNLYIGNNPSATGYFVHGISDLEQFGNCYDYPQIVKNLARKQGRPLTYSEVSAYFAKKALHFMLQNPLDFMKLTAKKALLFWGPHEISHNRVIHYQRKFSGVLGNIPLSFPAALSLFVLGVILWLRDGRRPHTDNDPSQPKSPLLILILLFIVTYFLSFLAFFNAALYRVMLVPFLLLFGAYGIYCIIRFFIARDFRRLLGWGAVLAGLYLLARIPFVAYDPGLTRWHLDRALTYTQKGQLGLAFSETRKAIQQDPNSAKANFHMGVLLYNRQKDDQAIEYYRRAVQASPDYYKAYNNIAAALVRQGKLNEAIANFKMALQIYPNYNDAHYNLVRLFTRSGNIDQAIAHCNEILRLRLDQHFAHKNLAALFLHKGNIDQAVMHAQDAVFLEPDDPEIHQYLGLALAKKGHGGEALLHLRKSLSLKPDRPEALSQLAWFLATYPDERLRDPTEAVRLAQSALLLGGPQQFTAWNTLAVAYAAAGNFEEAVSAAQKALDLAQAAGLSEQAESIRKHLEIYRTKLTSLEPSE